MSYIYVTLNWHREKIQVAERLADKVKVLEKAAIKADSNIQNLTAKVSTKTDEITSSQAKFDQITKQWFWNSLFLIESHFWSKVLTQWWILSRNNGEYCDFW